MIRNKKGFTVTELLLVIGIITILIGLIAPGVMTARRTALKMQCAGRLKDLIVTVNAYAADYHGYFPFLDNVNPAHTSNGYRAKFGNYAGTANDDIFKCTNPESDSAGDSFFYYYNLFDAEYPTNPIILSQNAPSAPPTGRGDTGIGAVSVFMCRSTQSVYYPHGHGINVVYADGHVVWESKP